MREPEPLDLEQVCTDVAGFFTGAGATIETELRDARPPHVRADKDELRRGADQPGDQLPSGRRDAREARRSTRENGNAVITVADDGSGIPADGSRSHIFEPSFTTKSAGTGLGLPIVKRLVDDLGGEIRIQSEAGKGTSVVIVLAEATAL